MTSALPIEAQLVEAAARWTTDTPPTIDDITNLRTLTAAAGDEIGRLRDQATWLNTITWQISVALGDIPAGVDEIDADPRTQAARLVVLVDELRRELAAARRELGHTSPRSALPTAGPVWRQLTGTPATVVAVAPQPTPVKTVPQPTPVEKTTPPAPAAVEPQQPCLSMLRDPEDPLRFHRCIQTDPAGHRHRSADGAEWADADQYDPDRTQLVPAITDNTPETVAA